MQRLQVYDEQILLIEVWIADAVVGWQSMSGGH